MSLSQRTNAVARTTAPKNQEELSKRIEGWGITVLNFGFDASVTASPIPRLEFPFVFPRKATTASSQRKTPRKDSTSLLDVCRKTQAAHPQYYVKYLAVIKHLTNVCKSPEVMTEFHDLDIPDFNNNPIFLKDFIDNFLKQKGLKPLEPHDVFPAWVPKVMDRITENETKSRRQLITEFNAAVITTQPEDTPSVRRLVNEFMRKNSLPPVRI
jgi:hypothetical protein